MGARCAACLQPIVGKGFVIADTEVMHTACAQAGRTTETQRLRASVKRAGEKVDDAAELVRRAGDTARKAEQSMVALMRDRDQARNDLRITEQRLEMANARTTESLAREGTLRAQLHAAEVARDAARRELEGARSELAAYAALRAAGITTTPSQPAEKRDTRDATEQRFSLIELDKP